MKIGLAVFITIFAIVFSTASLTIAQTINVVPVKKSIVVEEETAVRIAVSSSAQAMNAVSASLSFPATLSVVGIDRTGSIIDFWTEEPRVVGGKILFEGVVLNPGYQGPSGTLFTVTFRGKKEGIAQLTFTNAAILANDALSCSI